MSIHSVARKFFIKLAAEPDAPSFDSIKEKWLSEIKSNIQQMASIVKSSPELREVAFTFTKDPFVELSSDAKEASKQCSKIVSGVLHLANNLNELSVEDAVKPLLSVALAIQTLLQSNGTDAFGIERDRYLNLLNLFTNYYSSQGTYGDITKLNALAKRAIESKFGKLTDKLNSLSNLLTNSRKTGALDWLKELASRGIILDDKLAKLLDKAPKLFGTKRVAKKLENHEKEQILRLFNDNLHLSELDLMPNINTWNKYVNADAELLLSDVFRAYLRAPKAGSRDLKDDEVVGPNDKILNRTTAYKLKMAAQAIAAEKHLKDAQEKLRSEQMFGGGTSIQPEDIRQEVEKLVGEDRALWNKLPIAIQIKILNNKVDLNQALNKAREHVSDMAGPRLSADLFNSL